MYLSILDQSQALVKVNLPPCHFFRMALNDLCMTQAWTEAPKICLSGLVLKKVDNKTVNIHVNFGSTSTSHD
jgi:hypothetical protein